MKKLPIIVLLVFAFNSLMGQNIGVKTNAIYGATTTPNLGLEMKLRTKRSLDLVVGYNPWTFSDNKKFKHVLIQPEFRFWECETFNGHFWGIHGHYAYYNVGGIDLPFNLFEKLKENRYEGYLVGGGVSYGYHWILSNRWNFEATIGIGYAYLNYDKYDCVSCGSYLGSENKHYFGITRLGLSIVYLIK